jgi:hypothetical protein
MQNTLQNRVVLVRINDILGPPVNVKKSVKRIQSEIAGFFLGVAETFTLLGCYVF